MVPCRDKGYPGKVEHTEPERCTLADDAVAVRTSAVYVKGCYSLRLRQDRGEQDGAPHIVKLHPRHLDRVGHIHRDKVSVVTYHPAGFNRPDTRYSDGHVQSDGPHTL